MANYIRQYARRTPTVYRPGDRRLRIDGAPQNVVNPPGPDEEIVYYELLNDQDEWVAFTVTRYESEDDTIILSDMDIPEMESAAPDASSRQSSSYQIN